MKRIIKNFLRSYCPNIPALRKWLSSVKLKEINRYTMPREDVLLGEASEKGQNEIVAKYAAKWPEYTIELEEKYREYASRCEPVRLRKDQDELRNKVLFACFAYGFLPDEFFAYELEGKTPAERKNYISNTELSNYIYKLNDIIDVGIFFDKYKTYERYKEYFKRDAVGIEKQSDYAKFCEFVKKHPIFVQKRVELSKGRGVTLVDSENCGQSVRQLFDDMLAEGRHIVEERVIQSLYMARLSKKSVNTVRCMTFFTNCGVQIGPCIFKMGRGDSFVDNGGAGGILVGIDRETGQLVTDGFDEFCNSYQEHPDTHITIKGFQLPQWDMLTDLTKKLAKDIPTVRYIGWDLAHTENGWVIIEGNGSGQFILPQLVWRRGFKEDIDQLINS